MTMAFGLSLVRHLRCSAPILLAFVAATALLKLEGKLSPCGCMLPNLYGIHLDPDKGIVKHDSQPALDEMVAPMRDPPQLRRQGVGHTDAQGDTARNENLSQRRSVAVIGMLVKVGIDLRLPSTRGAGSVQPIMPHDNEAGRAKSRREELVRL